MSSQQTYKHLFDSTGHLTRDAMLRYLNNRDEAGERLAMDEHLKGCELCADVMEGLRLFENPDEVEAVLSRIDDKIVGRDERRSIAPVWRRYAAAAAVLVVLGTSLWVINDMMMPGNNDLAHTEAEEKRTGETKDNETRFKFEQGEPEGETGSNGSDEVFTDSVVGNYSFNWDSTAGNEEGTTSTISTGATQDNSNIIVSDLEEEQEDLMPVEELDVVADMEEPTAPRQNQSDIPSVFAPSTSSNHYGYGDGGAGNAPPVAESPEPEKQEEEEVLTSSDNKVSQQKQEDSEILDAVSTESVSKTAARNSDESGNTGITQKASYPGGTQALKEYLATFKKPDNTLGVGGVVYVTFTVKPNGKIKDVTIERGLQEDIDAAVVRFLEDMPKWEPALQNGDKVEEKVQLQIQVR